MTDPDFPTYVLDTGPLSHFAKAQWLGALKLVVGAGRAVITDLVANELRTGAPSHPHLQAVLDQPWIENVAADGEDYLAAFGYYASRLVGADNRNVGECSVLALAEVEGWTAVVDDQAAVNAAKDRCTRHRRTLALLLDAVRIGTLTMTTVSAVADDLISTKYRLPFDVGGFAAWAEANGLV